MKVQYAEAQHLFQEDIHTIRSFMETFAPEHMVLLDAIEKQNATELDYTNEARNLMDVANNKAGENTSHWITTFCDSPHSLKAIPLATYCWIPLEL